MLNQVDMVRYLSVDPPPEQHIVFSILHAYVFSKSRRGNLPSETLSKLLSVQRKLLIQRGSKPFPLDSPVARAFEAMRIQMLIVNKKWLVEGVSAFGPLGAIGSTGNSPLAIEAWRKATDNKVKQFPTGHGDDAMGWGVPGGGRQVAAELDAGRVIGPGFTDSADPTTARLGHGPLSSGGGFEYDALPPGYDGPPTPTLTPHAVEEGGRPQDELVVEALESRLNGDLARPASLTASESGRTHQGSVSPPPPPDAATTMTTGGGVARNSIEAGVSELARLRALKEERERIDDESNLHRHRDVKT